MFPRNLNFWPEYYADTNSCDRLWQCESWGVLCFETELKAMRSTREQGINWKTINYSVQYKTSFFLSSQSRVPHAKASFHGWGQCSRLSGLFTSRCSLVCLGVSGFTIIMGSPSRVLGDLGFWLVGHLLWSRSSCVAFLCRQSRYTKTVTCQLL